MVNYRNPNCFLTSLPLLVAFSLSSLAAIHFYGSAGEMTKATFKEGYSEGFDISINESDRRPLPHNSISNILSEIEDTSFHPLLKEAFLHAGITNKMPEYKLFGYSNDSNKAIGVAYKKSGFTKEEMRLFRRCLERYIGFRLDGHCREYVVTSLKETSTGAVPALSEHDDGVISHFYHIPRKWLQRSTNDNTYFVIDGPIAWVYQSGFPPFRRDAREYDPKFKTVLDEICHEVSEKGSISAASRPYYKEVQRMLKQKLAIDWMSPLNLNSGLQIDFVPRPR